MTVPILSGWQCVLELSDVWEDPYISLNDLREKVIQRLLAISPYFEDEDRSFDTLIRELESIYIMDNPNEEQADEINDMLDNVWLDLHEWGAVDHRLFINTVSSSPKITSSSYEF